jgi:hypothetical protein
MEKENEEECVKVIGKRDFEVWGDLCRFYEEKMRDYCETAKYF